MIFPEASIVCEFYFNTKKRIVAEMEQLPEGKGLIANRTIKIQRLAKG
jgi:hypothetical protein